MLSEEQLQEADRILKKRECKRVSHDYEVHATIGNMPKGVYCARCGEYWRVFHPVDPPTQIVNTIDMPTRVMPKQS